MRRAFSLYSLSIRSIVASAAARQTGFPPNVVPCEPGPQRITLSLAMIAPSGMPLAMPLAEQRMSGSIPACSLAHRSEEHTSELQSHSDLVCRLLLEKKKLSRSDDIYI